MILALLLSAADPFAGDWLRSENLDALACVTKWENLCAVSPAMFPTVNVAEKTVVVKDRDQVETKVPRAAFTLEAGRLIWRENGGVKMRLVKAEAVRKAKLSLIKELVPGGKCTVLAVYDDKPGKCLNSPRTRRSRKSAQ